MYKLLKIIYILIILQPILTAGKIVIDHLKTDRVS